MAEYVALGALVVGAHAVMKNNPSDARAEESAQASQLRAAPPVGARVALPMRPSAPVSDPNYGDERLFPADSFGEQSFKDFIRGAGGDHAPPDAPENSADLERSLPRQQPYFRSERTQGFNPRIAQYKLELFTGSNKLGNSKTGAYKNRAEAGARFDPTETAGKVSYYGRKGNPDQATEAARDQYVVSGTMSKMLPFEQVRVGPGAGYGANVAAAGGFHPYLRIMPKNVNEYRMNNLPGGVAVGKNLVDAAESRSFEFDKKLPPKFYEYQRRPSEPTGDPTAGVTGPTVRWDDPRVPFTKRDQAHPGDLTCPSPCGYGYAPLNATNASVRNGATAVGVSTFGDASARELNNRTLDPGGRVGAGIAGSVEGIIAHSPGAESFVVDEGRFEKLHRDGSKSFSDYTNMQATSARAIAPNGRSVEQWSEPQTTLRDTTVVKPYNVGIASPYADRGGAVLGPERQDTFKQLDKVAKRGDQVVGWIPGPSMTRPDAKTYGDVGIKPSRERGGRIQGTAELQVARPGFNQRERGDDTRYGRKSGPENVRLYNSLAAEQLKTNKFAKTLYEV